MSSTFYIIVKYVFDSLELIHNMLIGGADEIREEENPLGTRPVGGLLAQFAIPSILSLVVNALYNVVDQFFIGNFVGELGNAATNIAFPLTTLSMSMGLLFGIGGASAFNLAIGEGRKDDAPYYIGSASTMLFLCGAVLMVITLIFVTPIASYNYGAKKYGRLREAFHLSLTVGFIIGTLTFLLYQIFPRQVIFSLPLLIIFPMIWGIDGVMYVGAVADALAVIVTVIMLAREFRDLRRQEREISVQTS